MYWKRRLVFLETFEKSEKSISVRRNSPEHRYYHLLNRYNWFHCHSGHSFDCNNCCMKIDIQKLTYKVLEFANS